MNYHTVSWNRLHFLTYILSKKLQASHQQFDLIIAIARRGLTIGHILSDFLDIPISTVSISSYKNLQKKTAPQVICDIGATVSKKRVLLVDDVSDTGETFKHAVSYLKSHGSAVIATCAIHIKPRTRSKPDFYVEERDAWIIYPFEIQETLTHLIRKWRKQGIPNTTIKKRLVNLKLPKRFIKIYL